MFHGAKLVLGPYNLNLSIQSIFQDRFYKKAGINVKLPHHLAVYKNIFHRINLHAPIRRVFTYASSELENTMSHNFKVAWIKLQMFGTRK